MAFLYVGKDSFLRGSDDAIHKNRAMVGLIQCGLFGNDIVNQNIRLVFFVIYKDMIDGLEVIAGGLRTVLDFLPFLLPPVRS